ncbi:MAG: 23S rRNA (uracil(1939)-C(5))-methyltransferase RlmD [Clostridiales bacterium]|nr:23S rRNA (uracil(1939)-C(5))-methyltransferase RlmD [Clostridiales bacterium]
MADSANIKKNDEFVLKIEDMGAAGEGIGKYEGMTFFVKDALIGDLVRARVTKLKRTYGYARLMEILEPSPYRINPPCAFHRQCGGCQLQALSYEKQLEFKQKKVENNLRRIGGFEQVPMEAIVGMEQPFRYRNKAQYPVGTDADGKIVAGFYAGRTHQIIPNRDCVLGLSVNRQVLDAVLKFMDRNHISAYDEKTGSGLVRHVLIRCGFATKEIMVCLILNGRKLPRQEELVAELKKIERMTSVSLNFNEKQTNVILGEETETIWGQGYITDSVRLPDGRKTLTYRISPQSFYQVNPVQMEKLYGLALDYAGLSGAETVWDLYCGIGTISLFLAQKAKQVYGVEIVPQAIEDARMNARLNEIENAEFFVGKAEEILPEFYEKETRAGRKAHADVIVVDPPRKGCDRRLLDTILAMAPDRIVYVSCDSATLARDLKVLCAGEYRLDRVRVVDNFCQTVHVETVVLLSHKKPDSVINVKVEFGEGEGKIPLDNIEKRAESYKPKERVTYKMIKEYIEAKYGFKVHTAYIAEVKRDLGLPMYDAPNAVEELKQPRKHPTPEKVEAIKDALKYFEVI